MRFVSGPCSETQAAASSATQKDFEVRMKSGLRYPATCGAVPTHEKRPGGATGGVRACGPSLRRDGPYQAANRAVSAVTLNALIGTPQGGVSFTPAGGA